MLRLPKNGTPVRRKEPLWLTPAMAGLLRVSLAPWPRDRALLDIGGTGRDLISQGLLNAGFEPTFCAGPKAGKKPALPFDDGEFCSVLLRLDVRLDRAFLAAFFAEAARVSSRHIAVVFCNASLPFGAGWRLYAPKYPAFSLSLIRQELAKAKAGRLHVTSALALPASFWERASASPSSLPVRFLAEPHAHPFGAIACVRLDAGNVRPITPHPLRLRPKTPQPELGSLETGLPARYERNKSSQASENSA